MKKYVIINDMNANINFDEVDQNKIEWELIDNLNQRFVVSYDGDMPTSIKNVKDKSEEYTKEEIVFIMADPSWAIYDNLSENDTQEYQDHIDFYNSIL